MDVVVNNAGAQAGYLPVETVPVDTVRAMVETNYVGQVAVLEQVIPVMCARGEGVICTVTSASVPLASPFSGAYRASKAAMSALCETLTIELTPLGVRVLEVMPGPVATDGLAGSAYLDAVEHEPYRATAERMIAARDGIIRMAVTRIADDGPLRTSCDPMGDHLLATWRATSDQERIDRDLARYGTGAQA